MKKFIFCAVKTPWHNFFSHYFAMPQSFVRKIRLSFSYHYSQVFYKIAPLKIFAKFT